MKILEWEEFESLVRIGETKNLNKWLDATNRLFQAAVDIQLLEPLQACLRNDIDRLEQAANSALGAHMIIKRMIKG